VNNNNVKSTRVNHSFAPARGAAPSAERTTTKKEKTTPTHYSAFTTPHGAMVVARAS